MSCCYRLCFDMRSVRHSVRVSVCLSHDYNHMDLPTVMKFGINVQYILGTKADRSIIMIFKISLQYQNGGRLWVFYVVTLKRLHRFS